MSTSRIWSVLGLLLGAGGVMLNPQVLGVLPASVASILTIAGVLVTAFNERVQGGISKVVIAEEQPPLPHAKIEDERDTKPLGE